MKIICPTCQEQGLKSTATPGMSTSTCMGWTAGHYDEEGNYVAHRDPNTRTTRYRCSNGHSFAVKTRAGETEIVK